MENKYNIFNNKELGIIVSKYLSCLTGIEFKYTQIESIITDKRKDDDNSFDIIPATYEVIYAGNEVESEDEILSYGYIYNNIVMVLGTYYREMKSDYQIDLDSYINIFHDNLIIKKYIKKYLNELVNFKKITKIEVLDYEYLDVFENNYAEYFLNKDIENYQEEKQRKIR